MIQWHDSEGRSGLDYVVEVCNQFLAPGSLDSAATFIGRLVTALIKKTSRHLGDNLHLLLRGVLSKLQVTICLLLLCKFQPGIILRVKITLANSTTGLFQIIVFT